MNAGKRSGADSLAAGAARTASRSSRTAASRTLRSGPGSARTKGFQPDRRGAGHGDDAVLDAADPEDGDLRGIQDRVEAVNAELPQVRDREGPAGVGFGRKLPGAGAGRGLLDRAAQLLQRQRVGVAHDR